MEFGIFWMNVAAVFAFINIALVLVLAGAYFQSWRRLKSSISVALVFFAIFFLIQNLVIVVFWYVLYGLVPSAQGVVESGAPYLVAINAFEALALANLVRITWK